VAGSGPRRKPILEAMIRVAGRKGYEATSVADVVADAHASRATFYKYFEDKRACFLAAHELAVERIFAAAESTCDPDLAWSERAVAALAAVVDLFAREPELAGTTVVVVAAAGDEARRRHWAAIGRFATLLEQGHDTASRRRLPPNTALMAVSCVVGLVFDELQAGRATDLPRLLPELEFALLVPFVGPRAAVGGRGRSALRSGRLPQAAPPSNL
jgi:AcrR family transcriptional regulator